MGRSARGGVWAAWAWATWLLLPVVVALVLLHPRLRRAARERLGFPAPLVEPGAVWVHAASLGEGRAAAALIAGLRKVAPEAEILRTYTSDTAATQLAGADATMALPVDVSPCVSAWLDRVRPRVLILVEAELWPVLLRACAARGIPVVVVQARVAAGLARLRRWPALWDSLVGHVRYLAADEATAALVGGVVTGDLKRAASDARAGEAPAVRWEGDALVAGSTQPGEEAAVLAAWEARGARPLLVIAPRQPRRFDEVAAWLATTGHRWVRRSALGAAGAAVPSGTEVVLLDTVGELAGLYRGARVAFVGGTFRADVGGHSPAEALAAGCVVVRGPEIGANPGAWAGVDAVVATAPAGMVAALEAAYARAAAAGRGSAGEVTAGQATAGQATAGEGANDARGDAVERTVAALSDVLVAPIPAERPLRPWLAPAALVWAAGVALRPARNERLPVPVISVGALTAGGSGKTPVTAWLAGVVDRPAVVARGYGRPPGSDVRLAGPGLGDELTMLARRGLVVASCPDRARAAHALLATGWRGTLLLDDALQYRHVARDLEVVVIDARWPTGAGLLPVGTRRLPLAWLRRADVVWVNHGALPSVLAPYVRADATVVEAQFRPAGWLHAGETLPLDALSPGPALVAAGIARPAAFVATLRRLGWRDVEVAAFPDHHTFSAADLDSLRARAAGRPLVVTEKDAARLPVDVDAWALRVDVVVEAGEAALRDRLQGLRGPS